MTHPVRDTDHSALQFERVWVREAVLVDDDSQQTAVAATAIPQPYAIKLEVRVTMSDDRKIAYVNLRATLEAPQDAKLMRQLTAAVEGAFSVRDDDLQRLTDFARLQAPVLLLPYLRATISNLTSQSRLGAIVLPPLNMVTLVQQMANVQPQATPATRD